MAVTRSGALGGDVTDQGSNRGLVEIARINKDERDEDLPKRLTEAVSIACHSRSDVDELSGATWTIFAELIDNIFAHSATQLDGYAALQSYSGGNRLSVAVSDSGLGIMNTLRPSLRSQLPHLGPPREAFRYGSAGGHRSSSRAVSSWRRPGLRAEGLCGESDQIQCHIGCSSSEPASGPQAGTRCLRAKSGLLQREPAADLGDTYWNRV